MSNFDDAVNYVLANEKGYVNNINDPGKVTNYGISLRFLKSQDINTLKTLGFYDEITEETIKNLTVDQAKIIYEQLFWNVAPFSKIPNQVHCNYIFDMAVNCGVAPAIKVAQRATWAVMQRISIPDDGILGQKTLEAIKMCGYLLMPAMRSERAGYYRLITQINEQDKEFLQGWLNRAYESK